MGTILLVDDDTNITDLLKFNLASEGFGVSIVPNAAEVDVAAVPDLRIIIVDAMNQAYNGMQFTADIKSNPDTANLPVIVCTHGDGEDMIVAAFDNGADDFVPKPFSLRELMARVRAMLRRFPRINPVQRAERTTGLSVPSLNLHIDTSIQRVMEDGIVVPLTKTEYAILVFLIRHQNSFFSRSEICKEVWKEEVGSNERIVDTNISRLRKKLGEAGKYIINRYGMGYAFVDNLNR